MREEEEARVRREQLEAQQEINRQIELARRQAVELKFGVRVLIDFGFFLESISMGLEP